MTKGIETKETERTSASTDVEGSQAVNAIPVNGPTVILASPLSPLALSLVSVTMTNVVGLLEGYKTSLNKSLHRIRQGSQMGFT